MENDDSLPIRLFKWPLRTLARLLFRVRVEGLEHYACAGRRVLIVANHTSLLDVSLLYLFLPGRTGYAINTHIAELWFVRPVLPLVDLFVMDPTNPLSTKALIRYLEEDRKAVIFPEGRITVTGGLMKIYEGPGMVAERTGAAILPVGIEGAQYSKLSYMNGKLRRRWFPQVTLRIHAPRRLQLPQGLSGQQRRHASTQALVKIMHEVALSNSRMDISLFRAVIDSLRLHGPKHIIVEDIQRAPLRFRQLITRSFILGSALAGMTRQGESVGILLPNTTATLVSFLALQAYARIPAMLNFTAGIRNILTACATAEVKLVITSRRFIESAELQEVAAALSGELELLYLEDLRERIGPFSKVIGLLCARLPALSHRLLAGDISADDTAVILFTSGSEGAPKGVALSHRNLLANRAQIRVHIDLTTQDVILNALPVFHTFGLTGGVLLPLLEGTRIFLYPTPLHYRIIPELCYEISASVLFGTNTFLAGYARHAHPFDFFNMRYVVAGAEKLQEETRRLWMDKFGIRLLEGYGATEASPVIAVNTPQACKAGTVGRLLPGIKHYLEPVAGITRGGRLVISGPNIMKGYLFYGNDGELVPPWSPRGPGWYDTGDIVEIDDDGYVHILGRAKRFAKIGGEMVSLTAVEELAAMTWPDHVHAATVRHETRRGEQIVLVTTCEQATRKELTAMARTQHLPELLLPREIRHHPEIPVMGSGKTDYHAIQELIETQESEP